MNKQRDTAPAQKVNTVVDLAEGKRGVTLQDYARTAGLPTAFLEKLGVRTVDNPWASGRQALAISYRRRDGSAFRDRIWQNVAPGESKAWRALWDKREEKLGALLYGLDQMPAPGCPIVLVDNERSCHILWHHGFDAVGVAGANGYYPKRDDPELAGIVPITVFPGKGGARDELLKRLSVSKHRKEFRVAVLDGFADIHDLHMEQSQSFEEHINAALAAAEPLETLLACEPALDARKEAKTEGGMEGTVADNLVSLAQRDATIFRAPNESPQGTISIHGRRETWSSRSDGFRKSEPEVARKKRPDLPEGFRYLKDGSVEYLTARKTEDDDEIWHWLCSPIEVLAETRGQDEKGWGLLIRVQTPDGTWHTQAMTRSLFSTQSEDFIAMLADLGVKFAPTSAVKGKMRALLALSKSEKRARTAARVGWYGTKTFVLPDEAFGELGHEPIVFQPERPIAHTYKLGGSLDGWQHEIAARAIGNSRLVFAAAAAFAGPLLQPLNIEGGGFHLRGDGSTGKTSSMWIAGSVWGGGSLSKGFMHSWRTTDNGLESRAVLHSDTVFLLDELAQVNGNVAAKTVYMLANGQGKARAAQSGEGKPAAEFRVLFLSTGEISLAAKMGEDGLAAMAGQETRFIDLEADAGAGMGAFEDIRDFATPADFSDAITNACAVHYGHASRAFLRRLMEAPEPAFTGARAIIGAFPCPDDATGQVRRVAKRFALVAAAGEMATRFGILPWPHGTATQATERMFREWLARRGSTGALESVKAIDQVRAMIERHGASRFVPWETPSATVINRLGFVRKDDIAGTRYYVLSRMFKEEICKGLDASRVARELVEIGAITPDSQRKASMTVKLPGMGNARCYVIAAASLFAED